MGDVLEWPYLLVPEYRLLQLFIVPWLQSVLEVFTDCLAETFHYGPIVKYQVILVRIHANLMSCRTWNDLHVLIWGLERFNIYKLCLC